MTSANADSVVEADGDAEPGSADDGTLEVAPDAHAWSQLDPMMRFGVAAAGAMFCGVLVLAFFLVPYALISNGWTPSP